MIRQNGGFEMFKMIEVEKYPCNDRREADKRENEVMKKIKASMNKNRSFITEEEKKYYENNKDKSKQYREDNKDKIKQYREDNKNKMKQYHEDNKDKILKNKKEYYLRKKGEKKSIMKIIKIKY
jgi:hypothetical protein